MVTYPHSHRFPHQRRTMDYATIRTSLIAVATLTVLAAQHAAQLAADIIEGAPPAGSILDAGVLTLVAGALVYVVRQFVSGNLVQRDPAAINAKLVEVIEQTNRLAERALERERLLTEIMLQERARKAE